MRYHPHGDPTSIRKALQQACPETVGRFDTAAHFGQFTDDRFGAFHPCQSKKFFRVVALGPQKSGSHPKCVGGPFQAAVQKTDREFLVGNLLVSRIHHVSRCDILIIPATPLNGQPHERRGISQPYGLESASERRDMIRRAQPAEQGRHGREITRSLPEFNVSLAFQRLGPRWMRRGIVSLGLDAVLRQKSPIHATAAVPSPTGRNVAARSPSSHRRPSCRRRRSALPLTPGFRSKAFRTMPW